jgi:hypothetical protein
VIFVVEYIRKYESIFETALAHESVETGVLFDEKIPEVEKLLRLSLNTSTGTNIPVYQKKILIQNFQYRYLPVFRIRGIRDPVLFYPGIRDGAMVGSGSGIRDPR